MKEYLVLLLAGATLLFGYTAEASDWQKNISASLSNTLASGLNSNHPKAYNDFGITPTYLIQEDLIGSFSLGIAKEFTQQKKWLLKDAILKIQHQNLYDFIPFDLTLAAYGQLFLPFSSESQKESRRLALKPGLRLSKNIDAWKFNYDLSTSYFFHKYITTSSGGSNKHYGFTNSLTAGTQLTEQLFLNSVWSLLYFATYNATPQSSYSFIQEINYAFSPTISLAVGHSVGGRQYKNNGEELNLSLFDVDGSEIFMEASLLF